MTRAPGVDIEKDLKETKEWLEGMGYKHWKQLPEGVKNVVAHGQVALKDILKATKNDYL